MVDGLIEVMVSFHDIYRILFTYYVCLHWFVGAYLSSPLHKLMSDRRYEWYDLTEAL
jgi:hypothetical protein